MIEKLICILFSLFIAANVLAAPLNFSGLETGDNSEAQSVGGTTAISSVTFNTGVYGLEIAPVTSATGNYRFAKHATNGTPTTSFGVAALYSDFYFRWHTKPAASDEEVYVVLDTAGTAMGFLRLDSNGKLVVYDNVPTAICTITNALTVDTWYEIQFQTNKSAGNGAYDLQTFNTSGVSQDHSCTGTMAQGNVNHGSIRLGKGTNRNSQTMDVFYDDGIWDDAAFHTGHKVLRMLPTSNGTTAQWTSGTNASDWNETKEVVTDGDTTYVKNTVSASQVNLVNIQDTATVGISGTILSFKDWSRHREDTAVTNSVSVRTSSNGSTSDTVAEDVGASYVSRFLVLNTDPNTGAAWTTGGIDAVQVGIIENNAVAQDRQTTTSGFADFVPSVATSTPTPTLTPTNTPTFTPTSTPTSTPTFTPTPVRNSLPLMGVGLEYTYSHLG